MDADPFVELAGTTVVEADGQHAVARQEPAPELENHAQIRHAGALFAAGYAASRALVEAALGPRASELEARIADSETSFEGVVRGAVTAIAEPTGKDWGAALAQLDEGRDAELQTAVRLRSEAGTTTTTISLLWRVGRKLTPGT
jgi:acyl-coenzyme A thioesterase PaaI-like protein